MQRTGTERELVANFTLAVDLTCSPRPRSPPTEPVRATNNVTPTQPETGASEKWLDGVSGSISPTIAGDLNAIAGTMPNVTMTAGGPSILGSGAESNLTTLNGMGFGGAARAARGATPRRASPARRSTPRAADSPARTSTCGSARASRSYQRRNGFFTFDPPSLQFTDATAKSLGATSGGVARQPRRSTAS